MRAVLSAELTWVKQKQLDELAPTHLTLPSGTRARLDYSHEIPVLAVGLQEMFGLGDTPRVADGQVAVLLHLLSPARRPVQITQDLATFWKGS
jgi:ATP-dependent helicase HrpB